MINQAQRWLDRRAAEKTRPALRLRSRQSDYKAEIAAARDAYRKRLREVEEARAPIFAGASMSWRPGQPLDGRFARVYKTVMASATWAALSSSARDMYWFLCARFDGKNNGKLTAPVRVLRAYGIKHNLTRARALAELIEAELVEQTGAETAREPARYRIVGVPNR